MPRTKVKYQIEVPIHSSPHMLYEFLSTPSGLLEWFCDDMKTNGNIFTFVWEGEEERAKVLQRRENTSIRFRWEKDTNTDYFLEFRIEIDEITKDVSLVITDFTDPKEMEESKLYWKSVTENLKHALGAV